MVEKHNYKLTDEQFIEMLWQCNGFLGLVPKAINDKYGISYARQSVYERAQNFPDELKQIRESLLDRLENKLFNSVLNDAADEKLSARMCLQLLDRLAGDRGYGKNGVNKVLTTERKQVFKVGEKIIHF